MYVGNLKLKMLVCYTNYVLSRLFKNQQEAYYLHKKIQIHEHNTNCKDTKTIYNRQLLPHKSQEYIIAIKTK